MTDLNLMEKSSISSNNTSIATSKSEESIEDEQTESRSKELRMKNAIESMIKEIEKKIIKITINRVFSKGGFSKVYDASFNKKPILVTKLILKDINEYNEEHQKLIDRWTKQFQKEGNVGMNVSHKNINRTVGRGKCKEILNIYGYYIIMEKQINIDLNKLIQSHCNCSFYRTFIPFICFGDNISRFFLTQCVEAIFYFWCCQLVHLDVKPENIFLNKDFMVKLGDFSHVTSFKDLGDGKKAFEYPSISTPSYMAPEYFLNQKLKKSEAIKLDIYSIGILLLYMKGHRKLVSNFTGVDKYFVENVQTKKDIVQNLINNQIITQECGTLINYLSNEDPSNRPNIFECLDNDWINRNKELIKIVQHNNYGELAKFLVELEKSDYYLYKRNSKKNTYKNKFKYIRNLI